MQCDESCEHYEPCIPTCAPDNCDTLLDPKSSMCQQEACVEGMFCVFFDVYQYFLTFKNI